MFQVRCVLCEVYGPRFASSINQAYENIWDILAIVVALGVVLLTLAAIPREVSGSVHVNLSSCLIHIETQAGSPDTYFKTFVCEPTYGSSNEDCYFVILFGNGSCDEVYHYSKPASNPVTPTQ